jgi:hypothetical protein
VINPANYLLVRDNGDGIQTSSCSVGVTGGDLQVIIDSSDYSNHGDAGPFIATLNVNGDIALPVGTYRLIFCGTTSITGLNGLTLAGDGQNEGTDFTRNFVITVPASTARVLPATGFTPGRVTELPAQTADNTYAAMGSLWSEIPKLGGQLRPDRARLER